MEKKSDTKCGRDRHNFHPPFTPCKSHNSWCWARLMCSAMWVAETKILCSSDVEMVET